MIKQIYPEFIWDKFFWITYCKLKNWAGYDIVDQSISDWQENKQTNTHKILFAPEGRDNKPLNNVELRSVQWFIDHEKIVHDAMLGILYEKYPSIRNEFLDYLAEEADKLLPNINHPLELKNIIGIQSINIHQISKDNIPYIGIELYCSWDEEHGVGVLLHGSKALEVGEGDTATVLWLAKKYANE